MTSAIIEISEKQRERIEEEAEQLGISSADYIHYAIETLLRLGYSEVLEKEISRIVEEEV